MNQRARTPTRPARGSSLFSRFFGSASSRFSPLLTPYSSTKQAGRCASCCAGACSCSGSWSRGAAKVTLGLAGCVPMPTHTPSLGAGAEEGMSLISETTDSYVKQGGSNGEEWQ